MAEVILTFKIMPNSPDVDLDIIETEAKKKIEAFGGEYNSSEKQPVAFGLVALQPTFHLDEAKGDTEELEQDITSIEGVASCDVIGCTRALG